MNMKNIIVSDLAPIRAELNALHAASNENLPKSVLDAIDAELAEYEGNEYVDESNQCWVVEKNIFGRLFLEAEGTPFACSPRSETYWCS